MGAVILLGTAPADHARAPGFPAGRAVVRNGPRDPAGAAVLIAFGGVRRDIGVHFGLQRLGQHPPGALPHDLIDQRRAVLPALVA
jgi:hypothetical protein